MKILIGLLLLLVCSSLALGQSATASLVQDWACAHPTSITAANPAVVDCGAGGHGFTVGQSPWYVGVWGATTTWATINSQMNSILAFDTTSSATSMVVGDGGIQDVPSVILIDSERICIISKSGNTLTTGSSASCPGTTTGNGRGWNGTTAAAHLGIDTGTNGTQYTTNYTNAAYYTATYVDATHFSINLDTSGYGSYSGQAVSIQRVNGPNAGGSELFWHPYVAYGCWSCSWTLNADNTATTVVPDCADGTTFRGCARKFEPYTDSHATSGSAPFTAVTVSGGVASITLTSAYDNTYINSQRQLVIAGQNGETTNRVIWITGSATTALNRGFVVTGATLNGSNNTTAIQFPVEGAVTDGSYGSGTVRVSPKLYPYWWSGYNAAGTAGFWNTFAHGTNAFNAATANAIVYWTRWGKNTTALTNGTVAGTFAGTYKAFPSGATNATAHYYHNNNPNTCTNEWQQEVIPEVPDYQVGGPPSSIKYTYDPIYNTFTQQNLFPSGSHIEFGSRHSVAAETAIYQNIGPDNADYTSQTVDHQKFWIDYLTGDPMEYVRVRSTHFCATRPGVGTAGYEIAWLYPPNLGAAVSYEVRYSVASPITTIGFAAATSGGTVNGIDSSYPELIWQSPTHSRASAFYAGIRPTFPLFSTSGNGVNPIWLYLRGNTDSLIQAGDHVTVAGVSGNTAANQTNALVTNRTERQTFFRFLPTQDVLSSSAYANSGGLIRVTVTAHGYSNGDQIQMWNTGTDGTWLIGNVAANTFTLTGSTYVGGYTNGQVRKSPDGTLTNIVALANTCAATFTGAHGLPVGQAFVVQGSTDATLGSQFTDGGYWRVATVPTSATLTFACSGVANGTYSGDVTYSAPLSIQAFAGVAIAGTGNGDYTSGGTMVSTDDLKNFAAIAFVPPGSAPPSGGGGTVTGKAVISGKVVIQ